jgi:hypothetical protein
MPGTLSLSIRIRTSLSCGCACEESVGVPTCLNVFPSHGRMHLLHRACELRWVNWCSRGSGGGVCLRILQLRMDAVVRHLIKFFLLLPVFLPAVCVDRKSDTGFIAIFIDSV